MSRDCDYVPTDTARLQLIEDDNASIRRIQKELRAQQIAWLMGAEQGRHFVWVLLGDLKTRESVFNTNALAMSHRSGAQDVGRALTEELLELCPDQFLQMRREADERARATGRARKAK